LADCVRIPIFVAHRDGDFIGPVRLESQQLTNELTSVATVNTPANGALGAGAKEGPDRTVNAWAQRPIKVAITTDNLSAFLKAKGLHVCLLVFMDFICSFLCLSLFSYRLPARI
jgi:hypothetical protein